MDTDTTLKCRGTGIPYIPPELVHRILAHIDKDLPQLSACSLVCRSWSLEASQFIFAGLQIGSRERTVDDFVAILQQSPRMRKIKRLTISKTMDTCNVRQIIRLLPGLVHLGLYMARFLMAAEDKGEAKSSLRPSSSPVFCLDSLRLIIFTFVPLDLVSVVLGMFTRIRHLSIIYVYLGRPHVVLPTISHRVVVSRLTLRGIFDLFDPLLAMLDLSTLSHLTLHCESALDRPHLTKILQHVGAHLVELNFTELDWTGSSVTYHPSSLNWPTLASIGFFIFLRRHSYLHQRWSAAVELVRHAPRCLRNVRFHIMIDTLDSVAELQAALRQLDVKSLSDALENHPDVNTLHFSSSYNHGDGDPYLKAAEETFLSLFSPHSHASRVLTVSTDTPAWISGSW